MITTEEPKVTIKRNPIKFALALALYVVQLPLMLVFYLVRGAWQDCGDVGRWLAPEHICEHGVNLMRNRCDPCCQRGLTESLFGIHSKDN